MNWIVQYIFTVLLYWTCLCFIYKNLFLWTYSPGVPYKIALMFQKCPIKKSTNLAVCRSIPITFLANVMYLGGTKCLLVHNEWDSETTPDVILFFGFNKWFFLWMFLKMIKLEFVSGLSQLSPSCRKFKMAIFKNGYPLLGYIHRWIFLFIFTIFRIYAKYLFSGKNKNKNKRLRINFDSQNSQK